jgi:hypothetical protein
MAVFDFTDFLTGKDADWYETEKIPRPCTKQWCLFAATTN